jgi:hypothetical protein
VLEEAIDGLAGANSPLLLDVAVAP